MNWNWLTSESKSRDRQNRLAYVALLASDVAQKRGDTQTAEKLRSRVTALERSRLANEDTLVRAAPAGAAEPRMEL